MATVVNMHEAKTQLSKLVAAAERGEEIVIARNGKPVARLTACTEPGGGRRAHFGTLAGKIRIDPSFFDDMTEEELALWYGGEVEPVTEPEGQDGMRRDA